MKNISVKNVIFAAYGFFWMREIVFAAKIQAATTPTVVTNKIKVDNFVQLAENIFKWILSVAGGIALLMLIIGGITYITSSGNEQRTTMAKKTVYWALGGLMLIILAYGIGSIIYEIFFS